MAAMVSREADFDNARARNGGHGPAIEARGKAVHYLLDLSTSTTT